MKTKQLLILLCFPFIGFAQMNSSLDLVVGLEYSSRLLFPNGNSDFNQSFVDARSEESGKLNYRFGLNYNKKLGENVYLRTGLRYQQAGYKSKVFSDLRWPSDTDSTGIFVPNPNNFENQSVQFTYDFRFIEIPIAVRWEWNKKGFSPFFEAGLNPAIYLNSKSTYENTSNDKEEVASERNNIISDVQLGMLISFGANYNLNDNLQFFAQPIARANVLPLIYNMRVLEHLFSIGCEIGIRKRLN